MFDAFIAGFGLVFQWPALGFLLLGVLIGIWLGAVPGLSGIMGLVLLLPFTYTMDAVSAVALLLGMYAVTTTSDTITSVMLGVPGTAASQAIIVDGHPLAQKGHAARAFGASFTVSSMGGIFSAMVLAVSLPIIAPLIFLFTSPEIFMLGVLGLSLVGSLSGASIVKGLAVATLGLLIGSIGYAPTVAIPRYYLDIDYLLDGIPLIPMVLGLFALPELLELATRNISISRVPKDQAQGGGILDGMREAFRHWWLAIRCAAIGTYVGALPGLGGSVVDWIAYGHTVQSAKDKSQFGKGDIRGVIGPDAANNATLGGALIPTLAFGIPGGIGTAILLGALVIQDIKPGPEMLTSKAHITFSMVWFIVFANITASAILLVWARQVAKVAFVPGHLIVPGVILFVFMGSWLAGADLGDWIACLVMGIVGFAMKRGGWPRPPLVLALVLGSIMENSFILSLRAHDGMGWLTRPIVITIFVLIVATIVLSARGIIKNRRAGAEPPQGGEATEGSPLISLPFSIVLLLVSLWAAYEARQWPAAVGLFPMGAAVIGAALAVLAVAQDVKGARALVVQAAGLTLAFREASQHALLAAGAAFFGYLIGMFVLALIVGQKLAIPILMLVYLRRWAGYGWRLSLIYGAVGWLILVGFYDRVMHLRWHQSWLESAMADILPSWFPLWLLV
jgi:putative tricarboxylic transport membrane protein